MSLNWSALIIPAFVLFAGLEFLLARRKKADVFSFDESVTNISIGIAERLLSIFITLSFYNVVEYIYQHYRLFDIPSGILTWVLLLLATDLVWYWYHRLGHEINVLWAAHIVHHQSEDYNYTVSARITVFQGLVRNCFWCILPLIGFQPVMVTTILVVHGAYSFFTHTQMIGKLGWLEYILITPSHHRVHHASNDKYLNKNYGDIFVFWDKLFGTYEVESEKPKFGLTHPLKSHSFLWVHFHYYLELLIAAGLKKRMVDKIALWFNKPETLDQGIRPKLERIFLRKRGDVQHLGFNQYVLIQLITTLVILFFIVLFSNVFDRSVNDMPRRICLAYPRELRGNPGAETLHLLY
jgi:alkylglycerol monooxygenase